MADFQFSAPAQPTGTWHKKRATSEFAFDPNFSGDKDWDPSKVGTQKPTKQQSKQAQTEDKPKKKSILGKVLGVGKDLGNAAITGEKTTATGIARVLPGGTNDIKAQQKQAESADNNVKFIKQQQKAGKIDKTAAKKIIDANAGSASEASTEQAKTLKAMPSKKQLAAGFGSTAADILTAGTLGAATKGAKAGKLLKAAEIAKAERAAEVASKAEKLSKTGKVIKGVKTTAPIVAANAAAGGLNAAAGGADAKDIIKNAAAAAVLPEVLRAGGTAAANLGIKAAEKVSPKAAKELATNVKTNNVLEKLAAKQEVKKAKVGVADLPEVPDAVPKVEAPVPQTEPAPIARPANDIRSEIKDNAEHVKTITGKSPQSFLEPDVKVPKDIQPYIDKHQELVKEYAKVTNPESRVDTASATTPLAKPTGEAVSAKPETKAEVPVKESSSPTVPSKGTSKVGKSIEQKAIEKGLTDKYGELAQYDKVTIKDQAKKAADLINGDRDQLRRVINGHEKLPEGLRSTALVDAVERHALKTGDSDLLRDLAKSTHVGESSRSAQELRLAAEREPDSATTKIKALLDARKAAIEKRLKGTSVDKVVKQEATRAKVAVKRATPDITKTNWNSFVESIKC